MMPVWAAMPGYSYPTAAAYVCVQAARLLVFFSLPFLSQMQRKRPGGDLTSFSLGDAAKFSFGDWEPWSQERLFHKLTSLPYT